MMNQSTSSSETEKPSSSSVNPPPMMMHAGYPGQGGYPSHPPCNGYPDPSYQPYPNQPMQPQHMNNIYYSSSHFPHLYQERRHSFARAILCVITVLVIIVIGMSLLFWVIFGSDVPQFTLESMSVPSFEIVNSTFNAVIEANVSVQNPNKKLKVSFEHIKGRLGYKYVLIDATTVDPILNMQWNEGKTMAAKFVVPSPDSGSPGSFWFHEIEEDRNNKGSVLFSLKFVTFATFSSGDIWRRETPMAIICDDILVQFPASTGGGKWNGSRKECFITI